MKVFVDANVFLRHLMEDNQRQAALAAGLFRAATDGEVKLVAGPPVLFEVAWTLRRGYGRSWAEVQDTLEGMLAMDGIEFLDESTLRRALQLAKDHHMEFADAYIAASTLAAKAQLATFNPRDFKDSGVNVRPWLP